MARSAAVLVVGAGGAGLSAAIAAADDGATPTILEAAEQVGGSTAMSAGVIYAADTEVQAEAGIDDDTESFFRHYMALSFHLLEPRKVRALCEGTRQELAELQELGVVFPPQGLHNGGADPVLRSHLPAPGETELGPSGGAAIVAALLGEVEKRSIPVRLSTRIASLAVEDGVVVGAVTEGGEALKADAVVLATGGIGHDRDLRERLFPRIAAYGDDVFYIGAPTVRGDGIRLGEAAGAALDGHDMGVMLPTPGFQQMPDAFFPGWLVFVNRAGRRFVNETAPYSFLPEAIEAQPDGRCWAIMDNRGFSGAGDDPALSDPYGYGVGMASNWSSATLKEQLEAGKVKAGDTVTAVAEAAGIDARGLEATIARYNDDVADGRDTVFEKPPPMLSLDQPPFYAVELRPSTLGMTFTGLRIDEDARVLDEAGVAVGGLFAAGETTGGVQGVRYVGSGAAVGNALVFGRRAGRGAAQI